ncbi:TEL2-interacting protein 1 [Escovopsis weberi]|uniref:TEL2-interacting protein 1 n=1 Tax=Escovopsis weberi TaxID=150374 RepID=A0A0M8MV02_ESCWE|nr:TEL2-interacting protein 1 [Escovopsis weberi]
MEATPGSEDRNRLFLQLKPCCVKVSQLAIRETDEPGTHKELLALTSQILTIINDQVATSPLALNDKLAEYVFFPLYHVFRQMERYPMTLIENCIKCLNLLIVHGWRSRISPQLVRQIFSLLTFIIDGVPGAENSAHNKPEETVLEAFRAETALLNVASASPTAASGLSSPDAIPDLGRGITVMLDAVVDGSTPEIQKEALRALTAVYGAIREHAALANFLPGTVSSITRVLSSPARYKKLVLSKCLEAVRIVLTRVLGDLRTRQILAQKEGDEDDDKEKAESSKVLSPAWLKATVAQVKKALSIMMKLRAHESEEVRDALERLCISLLDECHSTLSNCTTMLVETAMILDRGCDDGSLTETSLRQLVGVYPELGEGAKNSVYNWMSSLPRMMQSSDEDVKQAAIHNFSKGIKILGSLGIDSPVLNDSLSSTLKDSLVSLVSASKDSQANSASTHILLLDENGSTNTSSDGSPYQPILLAHEGQRRLRAEIMSLLKTINLSSKPNKIAYSLLEASQESSSKTNQITALWLCFELLKASFSLSVETDSLLNLSAFEDASGEMDSVFNELYAFSLLLLDSHSDTGQVDWRSEAIALEVVGYAAQRSKRAFRPELIDVLFPVATFLGSDVAGLQRHAVTTLNIMAASCEYGSVADLIIGNVDYMVNAVSLRLNTLDISPASTQVLLMMVRLSGPRLVPFLGDVVESIFAALENYHGYPAFVESLFSVLKEVVDQAARADGKLLTERERSAVVNHRKRAPQMEGLDGLAAFLNERKKRKTRSEEEAEETVRGHPTTPWKADDEDTTGDEQAAEPPRDEEKSPNSPTYLLLQKVANLTQHYLTSPTPTLRRSLLELLATASPVLAGDEDSFLPLVNAIWPVVIDRLRDPEAFVAIEACHALSGLCAAAGDFLGTRFKTEWWDWMGAWCRKAKQSSSKMAPRPSQTKGGSSLKDVVIAYRPAAGETQIDMAVREDAGGSLGRFASGVKVWEAVARLLTAIVTYVRVEEEMFDEILDLMADVMERNSAVREALEVVNADAVWLARYERGLVDWEPLVV